MPRKPAPPPEAQQSPDNSPNRTPAPQKKRGCAPRPIVPFPTPLWEDWDDPADFAEALDLHMRRHKDTGYGLRRAVCGRDDKVETTTFTAWRRGDKAPRSATSFRILAALERRWRLPPGYFRAKLHHPGRMISNETLIPLPEPERRRMAWHLPDDFAQLPQAKRDEIVAWVKSVIITGATDYRRFQAAAMKQRFAMQFSATGTIRPNAAKYWPDDGRTRPVAAPPALEAEAKDLLEFKCATLTSRGRQRAGVWGPDTADQKMEHLGLMLGALVASPDGDVGGFGVALADVTFGLLAFPAVWDWYLGWRQKRRGFFTQWESEMLILGASLCRRETGWLRQTPALAERLTPIEGLITTADVAAAQADWNAVCDEQHRHALIRAKEIARVSRVHRDPFEPILPILEAESPVGEYRKITEEVLRYRPSRRRHPISAAESTRAFLMLRFGLHLGLRQKNLRQLLFKPRGWTATPERQLEALKRGELRWSARDNGWEVLVPAAAFKNAGSSYFRKNPFRLVLPDLGGLYEEIAHYIATDRAVLLRGATDPGVFFVKTMKSRSREAAYDQNTFYEAWRVTIQRYGIYNPYTGRGAIEGLLPHGPHNVRDVLATHVLKQTGSYEQASYAIQDTPDTIAQHYGRFLPQDKAAMAAGVLNKVWAV